MKSIIVNKQQSILSLLQKPLSIPLSTRKITKQCHVSQKTVQRLHVKHLQELNLSHNGRPQKLSKQSKNYCIRAVTSGKLKTALAVQQELKVNLDIKVDESTIRRALKDAGL